MRAKLVGSVLAAAALLMAAPVWAGGGHGHGHRHGHAHGHKHWQKHPVGHYHPHYRPRHYVVREYYPVVAVPVYPAYPAPAPGVHIVLPGIHIPLH